MITKNEKGFGIIEMLVGILLAAIMGAAVASNLSAALRAGKSFDINYAANSLANSKLELLAATSAGSLDSSDNLTETGLTYPNVESGFTRVTAITVNADSSRTAVVTVTATGAGVATTISQTSTFAIWQ